MGAQERSVRRAGDVLQVAIPALALAGTVGLQDGEGTVQFLEAFLTNVAATGALKLMISRERPDGSDDNSFPSGHTSAAFQGASFIHLRYGRGKGLLAYTAAGFVGFSRVYSDKHFVSDVVAGAALGALSSLIFTDRFESVDLLPASEGRGVGLEVRIGLGFTPARVRGKHRGPEYRAARFPLPEGTRHRGRGQVEGEAQPYGRT